MLVAALIPAQARANDPKAVVGVWWTQDKDGVVQIVPCGSGLCGRGWRGRFCRGWVAAQGFARALPAVICRSSPDGKVEADGTWDSHITNPDDGKVYTITLRVDQDGRLRMRGYIGIPLFGRTVFWTRFNGRLTPDCHLKD